MIKFENTEIVGFKPAIKGMRNPMNSWGKSDSTYIYTYRTDKSYVTIDVTIGENDLKLMKRLRTTGTDHRKYLRMINVYVDITAPLYWWKEFDTYKVGTVANSCSTMHKIQATPITEDLFSFDHVELCNTGKEYLKELEQLRLKFLETKDKKYWYALIQLLPSSYNQKRTVMLNYETLNNIYKSRQNHKLDEWRIGFINWIKTLPYAQELIIEEEIDPAQELIKEQSQRIEELEKQLKEAEEKMQSLYKMP